MRTKVTYKVQKWACHRWEMEPVCLRWREGKRPGQFEAQDSHTKAKRQRHTHLASVVIRKGQRRLQAVQERDAAEGPTNQPTTTTEPTTINLIYGRKGKCQARHADVMLQVHIFHFSYMRREAARGRRPARQEGCQLPWINNSHFILVLLAEMKCLVLLRIIIVLNVSVYNNCLGREFTEFQVSKHIDHHNDYY